ncbi:pseudaminic acid cytidylyltransferase [Bordetella genomosp. 13]|uniref:Pseudaminic acid cytidylyltransferase n=1 Tax=Bordetella genomosp. 13 TaxID=463040 RepID=A0A1W6Z9J4_9BORD|nr:pseudaminic acid cytidylyltransferase [Bordetella genomosp. 13]ARP94076.1 pseudaminic acid cytidylyltransferase [Bordetella genomosp. 13]
MARDPIIVVVPARGGSKRVPRKNVRPFHGKPMLHWPLRAAQDTGLFDRIVVSTDDPDIAEAARAGGAEVPFLRDASLADDVTGTTDVVRDAVVRLRLPDDAAVCCLYPTAAFVQARDLASGLEALREGGVPWVISVAAYRTPIQRAYLLKEDGLVEPAMPEYMPMRSQDLPQAFFDAGQFYWARAKTWRTAGLRVWDGARPVMLDANRVVDIDTLSDWAYAERLFALWREGAD